MPNTSIHNIANHLGLISGVAHKSPDLSVMHFRNSAHIRQLHTMITPGGVISGDNRPLCCGHSQASHGMQDTQLSPTSDLFQVACLTISNHRHPLQQICLWSGMQPSVGLWPDMTEREIDKLLGNEPRTCAAGPHQRNSVISIMGRFRSAPVYLINSGHLLHCCSVSSSAHIHR